MSRTCWLVLVLLLVSHVDWWATSNSLLSAQDKDRLPTHEELAKWDDGQLRQALEKSPLGSEDEAQLAEVVRRGGEAWKKFLAERHQTYEEARTRPRDDRDERRFWRQTNLQLLTALRRIEKLPDPLQIQIVGKRKRDFSLHDRISFSAIVINLDAQKATIRNLQSGGDDRSGRLARYSFEIRDAKGELLPGIEDFGFMGGGISGSQELEYGESWEVELPLRKYVILNKPGKYKLRLHYHNTETLAERDSLAGLITVQSAEIEVEITLLRVYVSDEQRQQARKWIAELPEAGPVKILMDGIIESPMHLSPTSPAGELQRMHTDAVPDLVDAAVDPKLTPGKRAWVLALLTGITGQNNPVSGLLGGAEVLGAYDYTSHHGQGSGRGAIDEAKQKAFAENWRPWKTEGYFEFVKLPQ